MAIKNAGIVDGAVPAFPGAPQRGVPAQQAAATL
jgi:hypothetical protein